MRHLKGVLSHITYHALNLHKFQRSHIAKKNKQRTYDYEFSSLFDGAPSFHIENRPVIFLILMITRGGNL